MKRFGLPIVLMTGLSLPLLALAQFKGPSTAPPNGNVPGVIWNASGGGVQSNAAINIDGKAIIGNDIVASSSRALRVDDPGLAKFYAGNWSGGTQNPFTFYINGDVQVSDLGLPPAQGNRGRVQATEFCFNPGDPTDCLSTWPNGGLYVQKAGDTMSGALTINNNSGSLYGLEVTSPYGAAFYNDAPGYTILQYPGYGVLSSVYGGAAAYGIWTNGQGSFGGDLTTSGKVYAAGVTSTVAGSTVTGLSTNGKGYVGGSLKVNGTGFFGGPVNIESTADPMLTFKSTAGQNGTIYFRNQYNTLISWIYADSAGGINIGNGAGNPAFYFSNAGLAYKPGGGSWLAFSDKRLKDVKGSYSRGLDALMSIDPVNYRYKKDNAMGFPSNTDYVGVVAQDVQKAIPEAVSQNDKGYYTVNNDPIIWTMLNSIKELKTENDALKARIEKLEKKR